jgi:hypothetical protein
MSIEVSEKQKQSLAFIKVRRAQKTLKLQPVSGRKSGKKGDELWAYHIWGEQILIPGLVKLF